MALDDKKRLFFDLDKFRAAVRYFLKHRDPLASRQLILVGQQNNVSNTLTGEDNARYRKLYRLWLENYKRIVRLIVSSMIWSPPLCPSRRSLTNPARSLCYIKNNVTGRSVEAPATNLVLDLKMRRLQNQDKLNYELNIGSRKFKCTTIPIYRENYGLVGAICINVDVNYLKDEVRDNKANIDAFIDALCRTDMILNENILSNEEYEKAMAGKRHFRDVAVAAA